MALRYFKCASNCGLLTVVDLKKTSALWKFHCTRDTIPDTKQFLNLSLMLKSLNVHHCKFRANRSNGLIVSHNLFLWWKILMVSHCLDQNFIFLLCAGCTVSQSDFLLAFRTKQLCSSKQYIFIPSVTEAIVFFCQRRLFLLFQPEL